MRFTMNKDGTCLTGFNPTGSFLHNGPIFQEKSLIQYGLKAGPVILGISLALGTGSSQLPKPYLLEQPRTSFAETQPDQVLKHDVLAGLSISPNEQLNQIKRIMGLNILELAAVLQVTRPTVYDWIDSKKTSIRKSNYERLNSIYEISQTWKKKGLGRIENYLHKPIGVPNRSLFDLLKSNTLNLDEIFSYLNNIAEIILKQRSENKAHEDLLRTHGFTPLNFEDIKDRLDNSDFLDL